MSYLDFDFPHTHMYESDLRELICEMQKLRKKMAEFIKINVIKYANPIQWDITKQYETNTIVVDPATMTAYISLQPVPSGVNISDEDYWSPIFDLQPIINLMAQNLTFNIVNLNDIAEFKSEKGDWLLIDNILYIVTRTIEIGTAYVVGENIKRTSVEKEVEKIYYPNDKRLTLHAKISDYQQIITAGDYHIYTPSREAIEIVRID